MSSERTVESEGAPGWAIMLAVFSELIFAGVAVWLAIKIGRVGDSATTLASISIVVAATMGVIGGVPALLSLLRGRPKLVEANRSQAVSITDRDGGVTIALPAAFFREGYGGTRVELVVERLLPPASAPSSEVGTGSVPHGLGRLRRLLRL